METDAKAKRFCHTSSPGQLLIDFCADTLSERKTPSETAVLAGQPSESPVG